MKKKLIISVVMFFSLIYIFGDDIPSVPPSPSGELTVVAAETVSTETEETQSLDENNPSIISDSVGSLPEGISEITIVSTPENETQQNEEGAENTGSATEEPPIDRPLTEMLFAYSLITSSDDELRRHAESYGIKSNYKSELLKMYGFTESEEQIKAYFEKTDTESEESEYTFTVQKADRFEKLNSSDEETSLALYGNVVVSFTAGGETRSLSSDAMILSTEEKVLIAYGNISVSSEKGSNLQDISSTMLVFTWGTNKLTLYGAQGTTDKKSSNKTISYYMNGDTIVFDNETTETYLGNATLTTNKDKRNALWSIDAHDIITKDTGDVFLTLMFLKIGRVPILPLPALFMPGRSLVFNPAIGINSDKGMFINTTTDIFGGFKESSASTEDSISSSFTSLFASDTSKDSVKKQGLIYGRSSGENTPLEQWAKDTSSHLTLFGDIYANEGLFLGGDTTLNFFNKTIAISLIGGGAYKPLATTTSYTSTTYPSWRYGAYADVKVKYTGIDLSLTFPFVSDPQFKNAYLNRITNFSFDSILGTKQTFPKTYSTSNETTLSEVMALNLSLPSSLSTKYLSTATVKLDASIQRLWKAPYDNDRTKAYSYKSGDVKLPTINVSLSGTLFEFSKGTTASTPQELSYENAIALSPYLNSIQNGSDRMRQELLIQRAIDKEIERLTKENSEEFKNNYIVAEPIGEEINSGSTLPQGFNEARATIPSNNRITASSFFDNSSIKLTYAINDEFSNTYTAPTEEGKFFGQQNIYNKLTGVFTLSGAINRQYLSFTSKLTPQYVYSKQENLNNLETHDFQLSGTNSVSIPIIGITWNLGMVYYRYKKTSSDIAKTTIEKGGGTWTKSDISSHNLSFSKSFINNMFSFSLSGNLPPLSSTLTPTLTFSHKGFTVRGLHTLSGDDFTKLKNKVTSGTFAYSNSYISTTLGVEYDYTKELVGMKFLRPFSINESISLTLFNSILRIQQSLGYKGVSSAGVENYFSPLNLSVSVGPYVTALIGFSGSADNLKLTTSRLNLQTGDLKISLWRGRIFIGLNIGATMNFNFFDPFQNYLDYSFKFIFEIKEFLTASISLNGSNKNFYKYFGGGTGSGAFSFKDMFEDLLRSLNVFNPNDLRNTNFVLSGLDIAISHDMGEWALSFKYTTDIVLEQNEWTWKPKYTILLQWNAIPELKVDQTIE